MQQQQQQRRQWLQRYLFIYAVERASDIHCGNNHMFQSS